MLDMAITEQDLVHSDLVQTKGGNRVTVDRGRDALLTEFGKAVLEDRYMLPGETFQDLFARVAGYYGDDSGHAQRMYDYISKLWVMPATPVLSNGGTDRGLPISCFLNEANDSLNGIVDLWNCFFDDWHMYDWFYLAPYRESFGAQSQDFARVRVENSLFRRTPHGKDLLSQADEATRCESNGTLDGIGNVVTPDSTATLSFGSGCVGSTGFTRPYTITLDAADASLRTRLETLAGN